MIVRTGVSSILVLALETVIAPAGACGADPEPPLPVPAPDRERPRGPHPAPRSASTRPLAVTAPTSLRRVGWSSRDHPGVLARARARSHHRHGRGLGCA